MFSVEPDFANSIVLFCSKRLLLLLTNNNIAIPKTRQDERMINGITMFGSCTLVSTLSSSDLSIDVVICMIGSEGCLDGEVDGLDTG